MSAPRFVEEWKDIYYDALVRTRSLIVDGYWQLKENRQKFKTKTEDFTHIQNASEATLEFLEIFLSMAEGDREKPGVQPLINEILSTITIHLDRIDKYYPKNKPAGYRTKENQREEGKFQQLVFKGEQKIKSKLRTLNIENDMSNIRIEFFNDEIATIPLKKVLCKRDNKIKAIVESLNVDWDLIIDNGLFINMNKRDVPDYNSERHFWEQEEETLQFWVSEYNKMCKGYTIDGYEMTGTMYFQINFFQTPIKSKNNEITNAPLRDNEWYIDEVIRYAEKKAENLERAGVLIWGTRRFSKTTQEVSRTHHGILAYPTETGTAASSNKEDLDSIIDKLKKTLDYIVPAFRLKVISGKSYDTKEPVLYGLKNKSGRESYEHFTLKIVNTDGGSKKGNQKLAGGNPKVFIMDEVGKSEWIKAYEAAIPSFESDEGWVCIPLLSGTGGDEDLSKDAEKALLDPTNHGLLEMDWDILEYKIPKEAITWERRPFGWFMPAQMSVYTGMRKIKTNLADFLDIDSEELRKVEFFQTDWIHNSNQIKKIRSRLSGQALLAEKVFRPIDPEECFLSSKNNPFKANEIKRHKEKLQSEGDKTTGLARKIGLERNKENSNNIDMYLDSDREVNEYPHNGAFIDCPFLLYDDFPKTRPTDPYRYVAGLDDYKQDESNGDSIGAFYIFDRLKRKIVLGLATRPDPHIDFHKQMHMALDAFNAMCFMENEDMDFKKYLDRVSEPSLYLYKGFDAHDDFSKFQNGKRKFGWRPDKNTVPIIRGYSVDYTKDNVDFYDKNDNITHTVSGFERIPCVQLLEEMIKFKPGGNFDRLVAFGSCLAIDYYLTCKYITPRTLSTKTEEERVEEFRPKRNKFFTSRNRSPFSK